MKSPSQDFNTVQILRGGGVQFTFVISDSLVRDEVSPPLPPTTPLRAWLRIIHLLVQLDLHLKQRTTPPLNFNL